MFFDKSSAVSASEHILSHLAIEWRAYTLLCNVLFVKVKK